MKKILFALPILTLCFFATYCSKEKQPAPVTSSVSTGTSEDRGGSCCTVTIQTAGDITVCGLLNNTTTCLGVTGSDNIVNNTSNYTVTPVFPSLPFYITNNTSQAVDVTISSSAFGPTTWTIPKFSTYEYAVATTCYLFADHASN